MDGRQIRVAIVMLALLATVPVLAIWFDEPFMNDMFARIMILAIAAVSLDFILGFGGLVSFGHAAYMGIGAYAVGILSFYGVDNGFIQFPLAIGASAVFSFIFGALSIRTSGVYFIMITLAFAQMLFFLGVSLEDFGGDDGMSSARSEFGGLIDLYEPLHFYYLVFACLVLTVLITHRMVHSRFGRVIQGARSNDRRMRAIGFPTYRYKLTAFTIAGMMCGLSGALFANWNEFVSPDYMHWTRSGEIMIMVILGGMGTVVGPLLGAAGFLLLEEYLPGMMDGVWSGTGEHWPILFGPILIVIVLYARGGIYSLLRRREARHG